MSVRNIVLVDDDHEDSEFFCTAVKELNFGIDVSVAFNADEMFQALESNQPDLVFLDSFLQQHSGQTHIHEIRKLPGCTDLPIIMYSGAADTAVVLKAFEAGATSYIVKPHSIKEIGLMMETIFKLYTDNVEKLNGLYYSDGIFTNLKKTN